MTIDNLEDQDSIDTMRACIYSYDSYYKFQKKDSGSKLYNSFSDFLDKNYDDIKREIDEENFLLDIDDDHFMKSSCIRNI